MAWVWADVRPRKNGGAASQPAKPGVFLGFPPLANLRLGVKVGGVNQFLPASAAMRPEYPGIAAGIPVHSALGDEDVIFGAGFFFTLPPAVVFGHFLLPFADGALGLRGQLGLQLGGGGGEFGVLLGLLKTKNAWAVGMVKSASTLSPCPRWWWSILVRQHHGDGGLRVFNF